MFLGVPVYIYLAVCCPFLLWLKLDFSVADGGQKFMSAREESNSKKEGLFVFMP